MDAEIRVAGVVHFAGPPPSIGGEASMRVCIRDVSTIDARAPVVAERLFSVGASSEGQAIPYGITFQPKAEAAYAIEIHVSAGGSRDIAPGDLITMESFSISTDRKNVRLDVTVRLVG